MPARSEEAEVAPEAIAQQPEELRGEVASPPDVLVHRGRVDPVHRLEEFAGDVVALVRDDLDSLLREFAALALHLLAPLVAQCRQVVVEGRVVVVAPLVLEAASFEPALAAQERRLLGRAEVHVDRRDLVLAAQVAQRPGECADCGGSVDAGGGQETEAGGGREGHADQHLRVVVDAGAVRGLGPGVVEDELALAIGLEVHRAGRDQPPVGREEREVLGAPAAPTADAARLLQGGEPVPLEKRRLRPDERVPRLARHVVDEARQQAQTEDRGFVFLGHLSILAPKAQGSKRAPPATRSRRARRIDRTGARPDQGFGLARPGPIRGGGPTARTRLRAASNTWAKVRWRAGICRTCKPTQWISTPVPRVRVW